MAEPKRIILALSGATGQVYGVTLLQQLNKLEIETHLIVSPRAQLILEHETSYSYRDLQSLATYEHAFNDVAASIASGSFPHDGMIIAPCSIKTMSGLATGYTDNLITRSGDVTLKEGRPLLLLVCETPLHGIHLKNLVALADTDAIIYPPIPSFYARPSTVQDLVEQTAGRVLDRIGIPNAFFTRWYGYNEKEKHGVGTTWKTNTTPRKGTHTDPPTPS